MRSLVACVLVAGLMSGCIGFRHVKPGPVDVAGRFHGEADREWSATGHGTIESWTVDGYLLHSLHFRAEVKDGDSLLVESVENRPVFSSNMTASEVAEFLATSMEMGGYSQVETVYVRPASFAGRSGGFEVEFTMVDGRTGLQQRAWSAGVVEGGVLYLVEYFAERSYYFDKHIDSVRGLVASLQL